MSDQPRAWAQKAIAAYNSVTSADVAEDKVVKVFREAVSTEREVYAMAERDQAQYLAGQRAGAEWMRQAAKEAFWSEYPTEDFGERVIDALPLPGDGADAIRALPLHGGKGER